MNAIILNGGGLDKPYREIVERTAARARQQGTESVAFDLTTMDVKPCRGCFGCWVRTPGTCLARDDMDRIMPHLARADWIVWVTPISFGGYGYHLKKVADRSIPILLPFFIRIGGEVHHPLRYPNGERRLTVLGVLPVPDPESEGIFHRLVERNAINLHARPSSIVLYGGESNGRLGDRLADFFASMEK